MKRRDVIALATVAVFATASVLVTLDYFGGSSSWVCRRGEWVKARETLRAKPQEPCFDDSLAARLKSVRRAMASAPPAVEAAPASRTMVEIRQTGFVPPVIEVRRGTAVIWNNLSDAPQTVISDPHPTHEAWRTLSSPTLAPDESYMFTFDEPGDFSYHSETQPALSGRVRVVE